MRALPHPPPVLPLEGGETLRWGGGGVRGFTHSTAVILCAATPRRRPRGRLRKPPCGDNLLCRALAMLEQASRHHIRVSNFAKTSVFFGGTVRGAAENAVIYCGFR